jgi:threonine/homoserine/homoserine lactone efflux protein
MMQDLPAILTLFVSAFIIAFSGAMMPGPLLTVTISQALGRGARAGPLLIIGHGIMELLLVTAVAWGISPWLHKDLVLGIIGLLGGVFLVWMGADMARTSRQTAQQAIFALAGKHAEKTGCESPANWPCCILLGAVISLSNPYWTLWWVTIGLSLLTKALAISLFAVAAFYVGHILADFLWYWGVAFAVSRGVVWLKAKAYRIILLACAAFLFAMGIYFVISGGKFLL